MSVERFEFRADTVRPAHQYGVATFWKTVFRQSRVGRVPRIRHHWESPGTECPMHQSRQSIHGFEVDVEVYASVFIGGGHSAELGSKSREVGYFQPKIILGAMIGFGIRMHSERVPTS